MLEIKNLSKSFAEVEVLKNIDLEIQKGEFLVLVGPSGCGKSTLIRTIAGLEKEDQGKIFYAKKEIQDLAAKNRSLSMVFQNYALYPHKTVFENISFPLLIQGLRKKEIETKVKQIAKNLSIDDLLTRKPKQLSGGQRQRVALARALVKEPDIFLLDEPLSNLDAKLRVQMRHELFELKNHSQACFIYVTHDQVEALSLGDKIAVLNEGKIQQIGSPFEIYNNPANIFVATFIGSPAMNIIYNLEGFEEYALGLRPEALTLQPSKDDDLELEVSVANIENMGSEYILYLQIACKKASLYERNYLLMRANASQELDHLYINLKNREKHPVAEKFSVYIARNLLYYFNNRSELRVKEKNG